MPEVAEVEYIRRELQQVLPDKKVLNFSVVYNKDKPYNLTNKQIEAVTRKGKYLSVDFKDTTSLVIHLAMTGVLSWKDPGKHNRFIMDIGATKLFFSDARKFGKVLYVSENQKGMIFNSLGIDLLSITSESPLLKASQDLVSSKEIKASLLSQNIVCRPGKLPYR